MKFKRPSGRTIRIIILMLSAVSIFSAIVPSQMARFSGTNVTQPSVTLSPSESISLVMGIPGFIYALLELAGLFEWKAKHWKSRTPVVIR